MEVSIPQAVLGCMQCARAYSLKDKEELHVSIPQAVLGCMQCSSCIHMDAAGEGSFNTASGIRLHAIDGQLIVMGKEAWQKFQYRKRY